MSSQTMTGKVKHRLGPALLALAVVCLSACTGSREELENYVQDVMARPADPIPPVPPVANYTPFAYDASAMRDPFTSVTGNDDSQSTATETDGPRPDESRVREYLEQFSLDTLSMVGTFAQGSADWALVRDPEGVVHRVAAGHYIGQNHGQVTAVYPDRLELSELVPDAGGGWLVREASVALDGS